MAITTMLHFYLWNYHGKHKTKNDLYGYYNYVTFLFMELPQWGDWWDVF